MTNNPAANPLGRYRRALRAAAYNTLPDQYLTYEQEDRQGWRPFVCRLPGEPEQDPYMFAFQMVNDQGEK